MLNSVWSTLRDMSRSERLLALAAALLVLCALAMVVGLANIGRSHDRVMEEVARTRAARVEVYGLMQASIDAETGQRGFLLTNNTEFLEPYTTGRDAALGHLERLRALTEGNAELSPHVERAEALATLAFRQLADTMENGADGARLRAGLTESKATMDALRVEVQQLLRSVEALVDAARSEERTNTNRLYWLGGMLALLTMIAVAVTLFALYTERKSWRAALSALSEANVAAEEARVKAANSDLAKTRFLSVASHDMRQPLHALALYLSALDRRVEGAEARDILTKMERATNSMITMFATLLDLARVQAGTIDPEIADFALQDVFDRIVAENPGGRVEAEPTSLSLHSDPALIERALRNLVANALKHGGGNARISATAINGRAEITVADDGPGISAADQARIFDEFVRLEGRGGEGLGLGLSIVKRIGEALDMPIEVQSARGEGARFTLRPLLAAGLKNRPIDSDEGAELHSTTALVVDDDALAREAVASVLSDLGADVRTAANEEEAQGALSSGFEPRLLVMDLRIDGELQGIEVAKRLRARIVSPPHVIVVTGDTEPKTLEMLQDSGFAWLIKPVSKKDLSQTAAAQLRVA